MKKELDTDDKIIIGVLERHGRNFKNYRKTLQSKNLKELSVKGGIGQRNFSEHLKHIENIHIVHLIEKTHPPKSFYALKNSKILRKKVKPKLTFDLGRKRITNRGIDIDKPINSEVEILLTISNPTEKPIGIMKILARSKDENKYPIGISMYDYRTGDYIPSFVLQPQETKIVRLFQEGNVVAPKDKKYIEADIEIYGTKNKEVMKKIPVKLYVGYLHGMD